MWKYYQPNPTGKNVEDCAVRAVSKALGLDWQQAYAEIAAEGYFLCDMPSANAVWGAVLRHEGFRRESIPDSCPDCFTADDFCKENPDGVFVLGFGGHVATVVDGNLYDAWDSSMEIPQYYWFRKGSKSRYFQK